MAGGSAYRNFVKAVSKFQEAERRNNEANGGFMFYMKSCVCVVLLLAGCGLPMAAQQSASVPANATVPQVLNFSGLLNDGNKPLTGVAGVTFSLYKESQGGTPLWMETQNVSLDKTGHYSVALGSISSHGLPAGLFVSGEARWLGVQAQGQSEQPRLLLMSVPYALKALDAETIGGHAASAFMLAPPNSSAGGQNNAPPDGTITGGGTANFVPLFTGATTIGNSKIFQTVAGRIGIGTTTPAAALDVKGTGNVRDTFTLIPKSTHPTLSIKGTAFAVSSTGVVTFVPGQTFPGTGTVTGVTAGTDLTGGGASGNVTLNVDTTRVVTGITAGTDLTGGGTGGVQTLNLDTTRVPQLNTTNTFTKDQSIAGNLTATGTVSGGVINAATAFDLAGNVFASGNLSNLDTYLGFAGNAMSTGNANSAVGAGTLWFNTTGFNNTATGATALEFNTSGSENVATGTSALVSNTTGSSNTGTGNGALAANTTGGGNTATGSATLAANVTGSSNTADGIAALGSNNSGMDNTGSGAVALWNNTKGNNNAALGYNSLGYNTTGSNNAALGSGAGVPTNAALTTGSNDTFVGANSGTITQTNLNNATAIGANAAVTASNALVLGSINGVNGANADTLVGIGTTTPVAKLDVHGTGNFTGLITFAQGQTFPGTGTITSVTAGTDLTGGGTSGGVTLNVDTSKVMTAITAGTDLTGGGIGGAQTLNLDTTKVPQLNAANTFTGNQTINGNLSATGAVTGNLFQIGSNLFGFGNFANQNAFLGFAGNPTSSGTANTATGFQALAASSSGSFNTADGLLALGANTTGMQNTAGGMGALSSNTSGAGNVAYGFQALARSTTANGNVAAGIAALNENTTGSYNVASGYVALSLNTTGSSNTSVGVDSMLYNTTGSYNTALGEFAGVDHDTPGLTNATAIGATADVTQSNSMVLGSIKGVGLGTADTNVGIGITAPQALLHIDHKPVAGGQDVLMVTSGGSADVASLVVQSTAPGLRLRAGAGTDGLAMTAARQGIGDRRHPGAPEGVGIHCAGPRRSTSCSGTSCRRIRIPRWSCDGWRPESALSSGDCVADRRRCPTSALPPRA